jgi:hypothetical protein
MRLNLRDARPHQAATENANFLNDHMIPFLATKDTKYHEGDCGY